MRKQENVPPRQEVAVKLAILPHQKKGEFFTDFGLRFFYHRFWNLSQIFVLIFFLHRCSQIQIFTHLRNIYTGVNVTQHNDTIVVTIEGSPATSPPVMATLAKGALMASSAVAPLAVLVLLHAAVAQKKVKIASTLTRR